MLANFFMGHYEKLWLNNYTGPKVLYYRRYVDDIFVVSETLMMPCHHWHRLKAGLESGLDSGLWTLDSGLWTLDSGLLF